jgi:transcription elongation factor Elf1
MRKAVRKHASCPFCEQKPLIEIEEKSERVDQTEYIRHFACPYCGEKVELRMLEYYNSDDIFQRNIDLRYISKKEDEVTKKRQRIINVIKI